MNLVRWQPRSLVRTTPLRNLDSFSTEMDQLFNWAFGNTERSSGHPMFPAMDVAEEDNCYVVRADLPGMTHDDIEITYQDGMLTLRGEKKSVQREKKEGENVRFHLSERFEGNFGRNLQLPEKVDVEKIEANFKDGVLELVLPFTPEAKPRKIEIKRQ